MNADKENRRRYIVIIVIAFVVILALAIVTYHILSNLTTEEVPNIVIEPKPVAEEQYQIPEVEEFEETVRDNTVSLEQIYTTSEFWENLLTKQNVNSVSELDLTGLTKELPNGYTLLQFDDPEEYVYTTYYEGTITYLKVDGNIPIRIDTNRSFIPNISNYKNIAGEDASYTLANAPAIDDSTLILTCSDSRLITYNPTTKKYSVQAIVNFGARDCLVMIQEVDNYPNDLDKTFEELKKINLIYSEER